MEETIFFNQGNALANNFDTKELARTAQIEQSKRKRDSHFVIAEDPETGESFLFYAEDAGQEGADLKAYKMRQTLPK